MKITVLLFCLFATGLACQSKLKETNIPPKELIKTAEDSLLVTKILSRFSADQDKPVGELVSEIGKTFLGTPYVAHTLENGRDEDLVINLRELDCTTFVETCLALARTVKAGKADFDSFAGELEKIRYRDGKREGYCSRLHYFSDWIYDNRMKGLVSEPAVKIGSPVDLIVNFMSTHPASYEVLKENPEFIPVIAAQETGISARKYFFLRKEEVPGRETDLQEGDLVGLATTIAGLDISHTGILTEVNGRIHLLHASSTLEKVVISEEPLYDLLMNKKSYTGIMIARPK
ncbi:N-acetylmuramoyl-L-alanine amidase-like domain-containing protein [Gaoshiqia sp. Z1-71]|uniref:N-acetylmuramoyl-L-alanine amidase-like domain-containing protein n=1 Tax=Gaoshiqia hydrogeniformans TaxID=3290090 RepID=UPI003BF7C63F